MRKILFVLLFSFVFQYMSAQDEKLDSLKQLLLVVKEDSNIYNLYRLISWNSLFSYSDTALSYAQKALILSKTLNDPKKESEAMLLNGYALLVTGDYPLALEFLLKGLHIEEQIRPSRMNDFFYTPIPMLQLFYYVLSETYKDIDDFDNALLYLKKGRMFDRISKEDNLMEGFARLSQIYEKSNQLDSAILFGKKAFDLDIQLNGKSERAPIDITLGNAYRKRGDFSLALQYYHIARTTSDFAYAQKDVIEVYNGLANTFVQMNKMDSAIYYAQKSLTTEKVISYPLGMLNTYRILADIFEKTGKSDSAITYLERSISLRDNLFSQQKNHAVQILSFNEQLRQQEMVREKKKYKDRIRTYVLLGTAGVFLIIAFLLYRNNINKQKANVLLQHQKEKVESTLSELKATQSQLIQSEKMASLGELTAGIAHEIQNPLNFVNNFSEVNKELLTEMNDEIVKGNFNEVTAIAKDVIDNQEKINYHGKRADAIVKGMLQHSRSSSGQKELTDLNALADEYLRLSYHGLRAKDKSFNATLQRDFDESIGKINIVPQDIGRVLLNLYNNAFYAVMEKKKKQPDGYEPIVSVSTKKINGKVEVRVKDNGNGIPQKIVDKIFQPFFTTKPTGQGTGLGLSLAYDIVKAHGGELKAETKEARPDDPRLNDSVGQAVGRGEGAAFTIILPLSN